MTKYYIHGKNHDTSNDTEGLERRKKAIEALSSECIQCGDKNDLMVMFTNSKICGKCIRKNHNKVVKA